MSIGVTYVKRLGPLDIESVPMRTDNKRIEEYNVSLLHSGDRYHLGKLSGCYIPKDYQGAGLVFAVSLVAALATYALCNLFDNKKSEPEQ